MDSPRRLFVVLLIGTFLTKAVVWGQSTAAPPPKPKTKPPQPGGNEEDVGANQDDHTFIPFERGIDDMDVFRRDSKEYLFVNDLRTARQADLTCQQYGSILAYFQTANLLEFIADALSETRLELDTLWVAGRRRTNTTEMKFDWLTENGIAPLSDEVAAKIVTKESLKVDADDRNCLGIGRLDHDMPQLRPLSCNARRNLVCQRSRGGGGRGNSTHPGWIRIRSRLYKIYATKLTYDAASVQCPMIDKDASLAVVSTFDDAQELGRYLLISRPSLENAWMGAQWSSDAYKFEVEGITLFNSSDATNYPPWRNGHMRKPGGCLLLDRHLANITLFVEARCERERALICYKPVINGTEGINSTDVIIGPDGYRLVYDPLLTWEKALDFCSTKYGKWEGKLQEIDTALQSKNLLYVMGENKTAVSHIWVAGQYNNESKWWWVISNKAVDFSVLNWVTNRSYDAEADPVNKCLDMDRENHIQALHYGTECRYSQSFVCHFPADQLRRLEEEEAQNRSAIINGHVKV